MSIPEESRAGRWRSWSGAVRAAPEEIAQPVSVAELAQLVRRTAERGRAVRPVGSGHSFTPIAASDDVMVDVSSLRVDGPRIDRTRQVVVAPAGLTLRALNAFLDEHGMALPNLGDIDAQTVAGALSTGTHGTGAAFGPLHAGVGAVEVVDGLGQVSWVRDDRLAGLRCGLGALGVLTRVELDVVPSFRLATRATKARLDDVLVDFSHHVADHRHAEFFWLPHTDWTQLKVADATDEPAVKTGAAAKLNGVVLENAALWFMGEIARTVPSRSAAVSRLMARLIGDVETRQASHRALASLRLVRFQEMEYALPASALGEVIDELRHLLAASDLPVAFPVEVRYVAADEGAWLSPAWERASVYVAVHAFRGMPYVAYFRAAEEIFLAHGGRPHWGKMHTLSATELAPRYPRWDDFAALRRDMDPAGVFRSEYLDRLLGPAGP